MSEEKAQKQASDVADVKAEPVIIQLDEPAGQPAIDTEASASQPAKAAFNPLLKRRKKISAVIKKYLLLLLGAILYGVGLETFLVPNNIIDGGIVGISIMGSYLTGVPLGTLLVALNIPFFYLGYKQIGRTFSISTIFSILAMSVVMSFCEPISGVTDDYFLATIFGGIITGAGVGLIIRNGGSLDGTEIVAIIMDKKSSFSVGEVVMFFNLFILGAAGFVFGWDKAMYSLIAYFIISKMIDVTIKGLDESYAVMIVSDENDEIADALMHRLGRGVTFLHGQGAYTGAAKKVLYCVVTRLEVGKLKDIALEKDETAFVTINPVHDIVGGRFKKKSIH